ncbi:MCM8, putative [Babesia bigemina]|uniref:DNA helicase n=1 Tax=Babesia bigemina TaxID=5866 RepID=A0A061D2Z1_BABBI|nr:MCM8, putative [Babesia bigemina]CDR94462.1 MCM8, putative [Babesia bigemina]|eukprot:XP_012766648.1 MCM8, putative [Babesia bigemina]
MMDNALFFSGGSVTASGLTAAAVREKGCSEYTLEAGALVLASGGTCCIDELDKTTTAQQNSLLEAMESQSVSLAKGGIVCTLTAQCTVICAANPSGGRFNTSISVTKNIKLLAPLVSRFDLIFFIADKRSEEADDYIASHILKKDLKRQYSTREVRPEPVSLKDHVTYYRANEFLDENLLRSYIEYAKAYVNPVFTRPARKQLRKFYSELRQLSKMHNGLVITTRQLEGIIRLCQARARGDLCDRVTEEHVNDVCELFKQTGYYPGYLDTMSRPSEVVEPVKKARPKTSISIMAAFISRLPANRTVTITHQEMMEYARQTLKVCQSERDPRDLIERANLAGHILKKGNNWTVNI